MSKSIVGVHRRGWWRRKEGNGVFIINKKITIKKIGDTLNVLPRKNILNVDITTINMLTM